MSSYNLRQAPLPSHAVPVSLATGTLLAVIANILIFYVMERRIRAHKKRIANPTTLLRFIIGY